MKRLKRYCEKLGFLGFRLYLMDKVKLPLTTKVAIPRGKGLIKLRTNTTDICVFEQVFIKEEYLFPASTVPRVIIDAGANIGMASVYYAITYPDAKIIAIEPEASNFEILLENTKSYDNIHCLKGALWNKKTRLKISNPTDAKFAFAVEETSDDDEVHALTVEDLMDQFNLQFIDILKVDIEGAEKEVFGERPSWLGQVGIIKIELHDSIKVGCSRSFYTAVDPFVAEEYRNGENIVIVTNNK